MSKIAVVYWSGTGNTEAMANLIADGIKEAGGEVEVATSDCFGIEDVDNFDKIVLGCPSMGDEELEDSEFEPMYSSIKPKLNGKKVALFGSYGWGECEWMRSWEDDAKEAGAVLISEEGLTVNETPEGEVCDECKAYGKKIAEA